MRWVLRHQVSTPFIITSNKNFILKYFRCRDIKRTDKNWDGGYLYYPFLHVRYYNLTSNKNYILKYFRWKRNRNKNWDGGYLYYPFLHSTVHCVHATHNGSQWWNAGMGNTDTLHPNSCFCSRQFFTIARTRETLWYLICPSPRRSS